AGGVTGWAHAEPILRSLAYALMSARGGNPAKTDDPADRPGKKNRELIKEIRPEWREGKPDADAAAELLAVFRQASAEDAAREVGRLLNKGGGANCVWDAVPAGGRGRSQAPAPGARPA